MGSFRIIRHYFTMIELLLGLSLTAMIFILSANIFFTLFKTQEIQIANDELIETISYFQNQIQTELKSAKNIKIKKNNLTITLTNNTKVTYSYSNKKGKAILTYKLNGKRHLLLENVSSFNVTQNKKDSYITYELEVTENGKKANYSASIFPRIKTSTNPTIKSWKSL